MAISLTLPPLVDRAWLAAPVPRPPQPIRAILIVSSPAAWALRAIDRLPARALPTIVAVDSFRNSRRDPAAWSWGLRYSFVGSPGNKVGGGGCQWSGGRAFGNRGRARPVFHNSGKHFGRADGPHGELLHARALSGRVTWPAAYQPESASEGPTTRFPRLRFGLLSPAATPP